MRTHSKTLLLAWLVAALAPPAHAQTDTGAAAPVLPGSAPPAGGQIEANRLTKVPKQTKFVDAEYPAEAMAQGIEADVILLLDIDAKGTVTSVGIAEPSAHPGMGFEEAALVAAQQFEFEPAEMAGKPIAVQINYRYKFRLKPKAEPVPEAPAEATAPGAPTPPPVPTRAPIANLTGKLLERGTRAPLAGAMVTVFREVDGKPIGFEATAEADGSFRFFDLPPGEWKINVEAPGYYPYRTTEEVRPSELTDVVFWVEKGTYNPFDVTVTATRPRKEVNRTIISVKEAERVPGSFGDPLAVVQNFAGVARAPAFSGQIIVRGSAPEDTRIFVDGADVPLIYHFGGLRSVITPGMLESIEFYPGNFSPYYGRATGGIIDVQVKKLAPPRITGYADVSLLDAGIYVAVPIGNKGAVAIAGRRSYLGNVLTAIVPDDAGVNTIAAPRYYDYQILGNYRPNRAHDLRAFFFGSDDRLEFLFDNAAELSTQLTSARFESSTTFYRSLFTWKYVPSESFENTFRISQGRNWLKFGAGDLVFDLNFYISQIRDTLRQKVSESVAFNYGVDIIYSKTDAFINLPLPPKEGSPQGNFDLTDTRTARLDGKEFFSPAAFVELEWKPFERLLVLPGFRVDHFTRVKQTVAQPRLTARLRLTDEYTLKGGAGVFNQEPDFDETDANFGNPKLKTERAFHYSLGGEYKPRPYLTFDGTLFYKDLTNLVSPTDAFTTVDGVPRPLVYDNRGKGKVYGAEILVRHEFNKNFSGWFAYTLSRSLRTDSETDEERLFDFDQTHILTAIASYALPRNWSIGSRFRLVSGNPYTPVNARASVYNASIDEYQRTFGPVNSARNAPFHSLDVRVDKRWIYQRWILGVYLDIQNLYNRENPEGRSYNYNFRQSQTAQGLPILTILGIRGEF